MDSINLIKPRVSAMSAQLASTVWVEHVVNVLKDSTVLEQVDYYF